jgi:hypothetical protein
MDKLRDHGFLLLISWFRVQVPGGSPNMAVYTPLTPIFLALSLPNQQALLFLVQFGACEIARRLLPF